MIISRFSKWRQIIIPFYYDCSDNILKANSSSGIHVRENEAGSERGTKVIRGQEIKGILKEQDILNLRKNRWYDVT